ncbi:M16 family metallopeptidase [Paraburkholderia youngii]|uniref:M16 family metallopeptidase n=1 Tax=Paraburkholderia youngii TaxID=2782701 RepID=UPI001C3D8CFA|nr:pitrilysin family protein [Paraburkholderia youngii]
MLPPLLYGHDHAYRIPFTGTGSEASIKSLTADDLEAFRRDWLRPDNVKILVAGDTTLKEITPQLDAVFGDWRAPSAPLPKKNIAKVADQAKPRVFLIDRPNAPQSLILAGLLAPSSKAINAIDIDIANRAFGGTFTSRLNMNLREEKRWSYGAGSGLVGALGQRPFQMYASVQADKTTESALEMEKEAVVIVGAKPLTAQEVDKVRSSILRGLPGSFETTGSVIGAVDSIVKYGRPDDYVQTLEQRIEAVSVSSAQAAIDEIVKPRALTWVIVGDLKKIEQPVRELGLGKVHVLDAEGRLVR